jgi:membrane-bound lytic murein transglycosylase B
VKIQLVIVAALLFTQIAAAKTPDQLREAFIDEMVTRHGFDRTEVTRTLYQAEYRKPIIEAMSRPAEKRLNWTEYRQIFLTPSRIEGGVEFWREHTDALNDAAQQFGVPPEIIVAILGVETRYGGFTGGHRVLDALHTLGFHYPRRGSFFREQLSHFLRFAREEGIDATYPTGSYAGAMGMPQFMPDSFRIYAIDFDGDGRRDIWENPRDVIGSVANYFVEKGKWQAGQPVTAPAEGVNGTHRGFVEAGARPALDPEDLLQAGIRSPVLDNGAGKVSLIALETDDGEEHWVARDNFYAIMRYNPRSKYAMAVFQLSEAIRERYLESAG